VITRTLTSFLTDMRVVLPGGEALSMTV